MEQQVAPISTEKVLFPLWAKLGLLFGCVVSAIVVLNGWLSFQADFARESEAHRKKLIGLAVTMAGLLDGDLHQTFRSGADTERPEFLRIRQWLSEVVEVNGLKWAGTFRIMPQQRLAFVFDSQKGAMPVGYPNFDVTDAHFQAMAGQPAFITDLEDEWGRWDSAFAPIRDATGRVVGLLEVDFDADTKDLLWQTRAQRLVLEMVLGILLALVGSAAFTRTLSRHLATLTSTARQLQTGNFDQQVDIRTRDEIGVLGRTFNNMVSGLREREFIRETFGRYVTSEVVARVLANPDSLRLGGEEKVVTILMSDLRGFTSLSERRGPEQMVALLNRYFSRMADVILSFHGMIDEFTGDGVVVLFGAPTDQPDDALRALACAIAMHQELARFNQDEGLELEMGIGITTGRVIAGNIGSEKRMKYGVVGDPINLAARLESFTIGSQVLVGEATLQAVGDQVETGPFQEYQAKGKKEPVRCAVLLEVRGPYQLRMPDPVAEELVPVELPPVVCFRIRGKQVEAEPLAATLTSLSRHTLHLVTGWQPEPLSNLKLNLRLEDETVLEDIYGKVIEVTPLELPEPPGQPEYAVKLRLTSVPERERSLLDRLLG